MATLKGREAWILNGLMRHGVVESITSENPVLVTLKCDNGSTTEVPATSLKLSLDDAIAACEQELSYWMNKLTELNIERYKRNSV